MTGRGYDTPAIDAASDRTGEPCIGSEIHYPDDDGPSEYRACARTMGRTSWMIARGPARKTYQETEDDCSALRAHLAAHPGPVRDAIRLLPGWEVV